MEWILGSIGVLLILLGIAIWRYKLIHLLSNVDVDKVINPEKSLRLAATYIIILGVTLIIFGGVTPHLSKEQILIAIAFFLPLNLVYTITYLIAQRKNSK